MSKFYLFAIVIGMIAFSSCKKFDLGPGNNPGSSNAKIDTDVYVVGYVYALNGKTVVTYWKNGVIHKLTDSTGNAVGDAIAVKDSQVYVAGTVTRADGSTYAAYWVNGHKVILDNNAGVAPGEGIVLSPCGCDVYVGGYIMIDQNHYVPAYWKNGVQQRLPSHSNVVTVNGITLKGDDVYTTGSGVNNKQTASYAVYWKNSTAFDLTDTLANSDGKSIVVKGSDVYVAGATVANNSSFTTLWKNGVPTTYSDPANPGNGSGATGLFIKGSDIYISVSSGFDGYYWTNNNITRVSDPVYEGGPNDITVQGSDVYTAGVAATRANNSRPLAAYWKNGNLVILSSIGPTGGGGLGIAVDTHKH